MLRDVGCYESGFLNAKALALRLLAMLRDHGCYQSGFLNAKTSALRLLAMLRDHGCYQSLRQRTPRKQGLRGC